MPLDRPLSREIAAPPASWPSAIDDKAAGSCEDPEGKPASPVTAGHGDLVHCFSCESWPVIIRLLRWATRNNDRG